MGANQCFNERAKECERSTIELVLHKAKNAFVEVESKGPMCEKEPVTVSGLTQRDGPFADDKIFDFLTKL